MNHPRSTRRGVARDHASLAKRRSNALVSTVLRTGSIHAREIMAELAWPGHTPADVEDWASSQPVQVPTGTDPGALADLARVWALQPGWDGRTRPDLARAALEAIAGGEFAGSLRTSHVELLVQLRLLAGDVEEAVLLAGDRRVRADVAAAVVADSCNPHLVPGADPRGWASAFSAALHSDRLGQLEAPLGGTPDFDQLRYEPRREVSSSGLVTVIMSAYRPGPALVTAVRSVMAQTWADVELLVVDDASGPDWQSDSGVLAQVEALDPRVRVIRKAINGGTYRARNTALRQARGEFFTVIDSDDRWHPQTLEVCLAPLIEDRALLATRAEGVRVPQSLVLTRPGYRPRFVSAATVLYRRAEVVGRVGFFDPTSKGADTEFARRLEASCGRVIRDIAETTTLLRAGDSTLSAGEFRAGWRHPARHQYKSLYGAWHRAIGEGEALAYLDPEEERVFPEPLRWERPADPIGASSNRFDLCLAGDWRRFGGPQRSMMEEIRVARDAGLRVAVMHLEALRFMGGKDVPVCPQLVALVAAGEVAWVLPDDDVEIEVLMIRYPPILQYPPALKSTVRARQVLVMANQAPLELDGRDQRYVVRDVSERTQELFEAPVTWVPQSPWMREVLVKQDPDIVIAGWDNPGLIDLDSWHVRPGPLQTGTRPIIVGRHSRDDRIKFPDTWEELHLGYAFPAEFEVRMLGGQQTVEALRRQGGADTTTPANWTLLPYGGQDVRAFLADLDFYLYLDNAQAHESFGRTLLEAAASGVLTIAHPKHRATFGPVLDYALPGEAQQLVAHYLSEPQAYGERVSRSREEIRRRFSHTAFLDNLASYRSPRPSPPESPSKGEGVGARVVDITLRVDARGRPDHDEVSAEGAAVLGMQLRSAADAQRADAMWIVHQGPVDDDLRTWARPLLASANVARRDVDLPPSAVPSGVLALIHRREGELRAWGRGTWLGEADAVILQRNWAAVTLRRDRFSSTLRLQVAE